MLFMDPALFFAAEPRPEAVEHLGVFAQLIGSWSLVVENIEPGGEVRITDGEWHFGWALDGRAVADVWISPARATRTAAGLDGEWGLSLRFYDPALGAIRSTWHGPARGLVIPFIGRRNEDGFVLAGERADGVRLRWIFSELTDNGFAWRAEETAPGAKPVVRQRFRARRAAHG